jgi:aryl-alcohol dehydrogenase-like predicted oxidoreductase
VTGVSHPRDLSPVGLGTWAMGGGDLSAYGWAPADDMVSIETVRDAVDLGINWVDTAPSYGFGHAEEVVGRALRSSGALDRPIVATKCGSRIGAQDGRPFVNDLTPEHIRLECENSIRRLRVDVLDILKFHWPDDCTGTPLLTSWEAADSLVTSGKVRFIGLSNFSLEEVRLCHAHRPVDIVQVPLSLVRRGESVRTLAWCRDEGVAATVYSPMHLGLLTNSFDTGSCRYLPRAIRTRRDFAPDLVARNLALRDALLPLANEHSVDVAAISVAWALAWQGVTAAAVGATTPTQLAGWAPAISLRLSASELTRIANAIRATGAGEGPDRPADHTSLGALDALTATSVED